MLSFNMSTIKQTRQPRSCPLLLSLTHTHFLNSLSAEITTSYSIISPTTHQLTCSCLRYPFTKTKACFQSEIFQVFEYSTKLFSWITSISSGALITAHTKCTYQVTHCIKKVPQCLEHFK